MLTQGTLTTSCKVSYALLWFVDVAYPVLTAACGDMSVCVKTYILWSTNAEFTIWYPRLESTEVSLEKRNVSITTGFHTLFLMRPTSVGGCTYVEVLHFSGSLI